MCAGAYVSIKGGNIEFGCPGTIEFQSATQTVGGPVSLYPDMPVFPSSPDFCLECLIKALKARSALAKV
jgi:type VI secretion system secreted protein VgrG